MYRFYNTYSNALLPVTLYLATKFCCLYYKNRNYAKVLRKKRKMNPLPSESFRICRCFKIINIQKNTRLFFLFCFWYSISINSCSLC